MPLITGITIADDGLEARSVDTVVELKTRILAKNDALAAKAGPGSRSESFSGRSGLMLRKYRAIE
jgi:hypothetical protein